MTKIPVPIAERFFSGGSASGRGFDTDLLGIPGVTVDYDTQATLHTGSGTGSCAATFPNLSEYDCNFGPRIRGGNGFLAINTELRILRLRETAYDVAKELDLAHNRKFLPEKIRPANEEQTISITSGEKDARAEMSKLGDEINELLRRVRERAEQNHAQLRRARELMERFISTISPQAQTTLLVGEQDPSDAEPPPFLSAIA